MWFGPWVACWAGDAYAARPRVAVVISDDLQVYEAPVEPFLDALEAGPDPTVTRINLHGRESEVRAAVERLVEERPGAVLCIGAKACWAVRRHLPQVATVHAMILDPERYGIVGPAVTGVTLTVPTVTYLGEVVGFFPDVARVGVLRGPDATEGELVRLTGAAIEVGVDLVVEVVAQPSEARAALQSLVARDIDALWVPPDRDVLGPSAFRMLADEARRRHLPLLVDTDNMVRAGGMFAVVPDPAGIGRQAADLVIQLLDGRAPAVIPAQDPVELRIVVNAGALDRAGVPLDPLLRDFVDDLIE